MCPWAIFHCGHRHCMAVSLTVLGTAPISTLPRVPAAGAGCNTNTNSADDGARRFIFFRNVQNQTGGSEPTCCRTKKPRLSLVEPRSGSSRCSIIQFVLGVGLSVMGPLRGAIAVAALSVFCDRSSYAFTTFARTKLSTRAPTGLPLETTGAGAAPAASADAGKVMANDTCMRPYVCACCSTVALLHRLYFFEVQILSSCSS